jgi:hypothetical protein
MSDFRIEEPKPKADPKTTHYLYGAVPGGNNFKYACPLCRKQGEIPYKLKQEYTVLNAICKCGCGIKFNFKKPVIK